MGRSSVSPDLPGYVFCFGLQMIEDFGYASMPMAFRDQTALRLFRKDGEIRARSGLFTLSRADGRRSSPRSQQRRHRPDGENEWRRSARR